LLIRILLPLLLVLLEYPIDGSVVPRLFALLLCLLHPWWRLWRLLSIPSP